MKTTISPIILGIALGLILFSAVTFTLDKKIEIIQKELTRQASILTKHEALFANQTRPVINIKYGQIYATEGEVIVEEMGK